MSAIVVIDDVLDQLREENQRLLNELMIADKWQKTFLEFKTFIDSVFSVINVNTNCLQKYNELSFRLENELKVRPIPKPVPVRDQLKAAIKWEESLRSESNATDAETDDDNPNDGSNDCDYEVSENERVERIERPKMCVKSGDNLLPLMSTDLDQLADQLDPQIVNEVRVMCTVEGCDRSFKNMDIRNIHLRTYHSEDQRVPCTFEGCTKVFKNKTYMRGHYAIVHKRKSEPKVPCTWPGCKFMGNQAYMKKHMQNHRNEANWLCEFPGCGKRFTTKFVMHEHMKRLHIGERVIPCLWPGCEFKAVSQEHRRQHARSHNPKKFVCDWPGCDKGFTCAQHLTNHINAVHKELKQFACPHPGCDYKGSTNQRVNEHLKTHTRDPNAPKRFHCDWPGCDYQTNSKKDCGNHRRVHTHEKPFVCTFPGCDYRCSQQQYLKVHQAIHGEERRYACTADGCSMKFKQYKGLAKHRKNVHHLTGPIRRHE